MYLVQTFVSFEVLEITSMINCNIFISLLTVGEIIEWLGFSIAAWNLTAFSFALYTMANLIPRAMDHHRWYHSKFEDYPKNRKAVIPYIL